MNNQKSKKKSRAIVLYSGGLDSKLAVKMIQEQGIRVDAVMFKLPFSSFEDSDFLKKLKVPLHIIEFKSRLFQRYLKMVKNPKFGHGSGINPCIDCRIFILKEVKKLAKKIKADFIATGEVLGERPMSQHKKALMLIEKKSGLEGKILRPLSAKLLPETEAEKKKLVERGKLLDIRGRRRQRQIALAKKYQISFPNPAGGCLLCDKEYSKRVKDLFRHKEKITQEDIQSLKTGRHFRSSGKIILGKNKTENENLEKLNKKLKFNKIIPKKAGPTALFEDKKDKKTAEEMIKAYSSKNLNKRKKFEKLKA